jgi:hypothetical protein
VGHTYAGGGGYCPLAAYPGRHGYDLVCKFAALAMNILLLMGQRGLLEDADRANSTQVSGRGSRIQEKYSLGYFVE